jgi:Protein of unknown function (DUF2934)
MAGKTPGTPRKNTSRKPTAKSSSSVTPINQGNGNQGNGAPSYAKADLGELQEQIRARAYELYEARGRQEGFHDQDWAQAEAEVLSRYQREKSA